MRILTYCAVGVRAGRAAQLLQDAGYTRVVNGGGWNHGDERKVLQEQCPGGAQGGAIGGDSTRKGGSLPVGVIVGASCGGVALVLAVAGAVMRCAARTSTAAKYSELSIQADPVQGAWGGGAA